MSQTKQNDLTTGGILRKLLLVAIPIMGTSLMQMAYNLTDMFWLGQGVGGDAVAASGTAGMFLWLSMALVMFGRLGAEIGVSQNVGRQDYDTARAFAHNAVVLAAVLGTLYGLVLMIFNRPLTGIMNLQDPQVARNAADYLAVVGIGIPFTFVSAALTGTFNGSGNSHVSFWANAVGLAVNMVLDPLMIVGLGWGVIGAAVATILAQILVCVLFMVFIKRHKSRPFASFHFLRRPRPELLRTIGRWGWPTALESACFTALAMMTAALVNSFGTAATTAQRIGSQIESLSWLIGGGFGTAVTAFVGQNFGAGKWRRIHRGFRLSLLAMVIWGVVVTGLLFFGGRLMYRLFLKAEEVQVLDMGAVYLKILAACQILSCVEAVPAGAFRGMGKTVPPMLISVFNNLIRVPLAYVLAATALGVYGAWWAVSITCALRGGMMLVCYLWYARRQPKADAEPIAAPAGLEPIPEA